MPFGGDGAEGEPGFENEFAFVDSRPTHLRMSLVPSLVNIAWCEAQKKKEEEWAKETEELKKQYHPIPELLGYTTSEQIADWVAVQEQRWKSIPEQHWETQQIMYREKREREPLVEKCKKYLAEHPADPSKLTPLTPLPPVTNPNGGQFVLPPGFYTSLNPGSAQPALTQTTPNPQVVQWVQGNRIIMRPEHREVMPGERMNRVKLR